MMRKVNVATICILIVEDNDASRRLALELLRAAGFTNLYFARNAEEAIDQMQSHVPDLILLDWGLPGMSGIELVGHIRQAALKPDPRFLNPQVPIVMLTARQRARDVAQARNAGVNEFVVKPFSTVSLLKAVCRALVKKRAFITVPDFQGPDRRAKPSLTNLLKRGEDMVEWFSEPVRTLVNRIASPMAEVAGLRNLLKSGVTPDIAMLEEVTQRLMQAQSEAHDLRMQLITQTMESLRDYMRLFGSDAEADVLDVHLESLLQLNGMSMDDHEQARMIVKHLETLVAKRRRNRRLTA